MNKEVQKNNWFVANYYEEFKCKADKCRNCCCQGWQIRVSEAEYLALQELKLTTDLKEKLATAFKDPSEVTPDCYKIIDTTASNHCPLLDEAGLCLLHKEVGPEILPSVCQLYPRQLLNFGGSDKAVCSTSCEATVETLIELNHFKINKKELEGEATIKLAYPRSYWNYHYKLLNSFIASSSKTSVKISEAINLDLAPTKKLKSLVSILENILTVLSEYNHTPKVILEKYHLVSDRQLFNQLEAKEKELFPKLDKWLSNILANHIFYMNYPFVDNRVTLDKAGIGLVVGYDLLKVLITSNMDQINNTNDLVDLIALVFHLLEHTPFYYNCCVLIKDLSQLYII